MGARGAVRERRRHERERDIVILGAGMHPWGKWGRDFTEYGMVAARAALADAGVAWTDIDYVAGADTIRNGYPGFIAGSTFAQKLGWIGVPVSSSYAACACGSQALQTARAQILAGFADVALVVGADTTPKGFFAPVGGERKTDPDWQRFHLLGATNPVYFALYARRRMDVYGATSEDFAQVKVKNSRHGLENPNARFRKENTVDDVLNSPIVSDPLRLLDICATSDGAAALIVASAEYAERKLGSSTVCPASGRCAPSTPTYPQTLLELPDIATDSTAVVGAAGARLQGLDRLRRLRGGRHRPGGRLSLAEVYDLSTALELDWYEHIGLCAEGEAEQLLRYGRHDDRRPHPRQPVGRPGLLRRGDPRPGDRPGVRAHLAAARPGRRSPGRGRDGRHHRQPGSVRPRLVRDREHLKETLMAEAFIVDAVRSPVGRRGGGPLQVHPADLGAHSSRRSSSAPASTPARSTTSCSATSTRSVRRPATSPAPAGSSPGCPSTCPAPPIDRQCGSAQQAVHFAAQGVMSGTQDLVVAGGVQNMSQIPISVGDDRGRAARLHRSVQRVDGMGRPLRQRAR